MSDPDNKYDSKLFIMEELIRVPQMAGDEKLEKIMQRSIDRRKAANDAAIDMIEERGIETCMTMMSDIIDRVEILSVLVEMGWAVDGFNGVQSVFNKTAQKIAERGDIQTAAMFRLFAIGVMIVGARPTTIGVFDVLLNSIYDLKIKQPTNADWDKAYATAMLAEAEVEFDWQQSQESNDDELD